MHKNIKDVAVATAVGAGVFALIWGGMMAIARMVMP